MDLLSSHLNLIVRLFSPVRRWSSETGPRKIGSAELHDMLAEYIYSESPEPVHLLYIFAGHNLFFIYCDEGKMLKKKEYCL